jgi:hypothetical protein
MANLPTVTTAAVFSVVLVDLFDPLGLLDVVLIATD